MEVVGWTTPQEAPKVETPKAPVESSAIEVKTASPRGRKPKSKDDD